MCGEICPKVEFPSLSPFNQTQESSIAKQKSCILEADLVESLKPLVSSNH